jgi:hypothetical protein
MKDYSERAAGLKAQLLSIDQNTSAELIALEQAATRAKEKQASDIAAAQTAFTVDQRKAEDKIASFAGIKLSPVIKAFRANPTRETAAAVADALRFIRTEEQRLKGVVTDRWPALGFGRSIVAADPAAVGAFVSGWAGLTDAAGLVWPNYRVICALKDPHNTQEALDALLVLERRCLECARMAAATHTADAGETLREKFEVITKCRARDVEEAELRAVDQRRSAARAAAREARTDLMRRARAGDVDAMNELGPALLQQVRTLGESIFGRVSNRFAEATGSTADTPIRSESP